MLTKMRIVLEELNKGFSIIIAPRGTGTTVSFNVPGKMAIALLIILGALVIGLAFSGYTYIRLTVLAMEVERLERRNEELRIQAQKIDEIRAELAEVDRMRRHIESWAGMAPIEPQVGRGQEDVYHYVPTWPRRYSYEIMREVYRYQIRGLPDMIVPTPGWVSRWYAGKSDGEASHPGVDIVAATGTPVRAALGGEVVFAGWDDIYGNLVRVRHNDSVATVYGHNDEVLVDEGDSVEKGEVIARVGSTGRSTAPHLHFEVLKNGIAEDPGLYVNLGHMKAHGD